MGRTDPLPVKPNGFYASINDGRKKAFLFVIVHHKTNLTKKKNTTKKKKPMKELKTK